ncbi:FAD-binding domain-containing protein [Roridomyces roridus]|uniref:FAD-binding domain-containing protein n=1 Tax=Roridomyces roridus TaxID=1738132 RepID=A0AAD7FRU0_9AGAR|nr:FAD-binding domain-containing protein [Roridomyces roridus]
MNNTRLSRKMIVNNQAHASPESEAYSAILAVLGPTLVKSSGAQYDATSTGTWSLFNSLDRPTCIVYPRTASDVQVAMNNIYAFGSRYAVRAGGHSPMMGHNSISNGVLVSFENMAHVSYDAQTNLISLEPGVLLSDAELVLEPHGVSLIGGRATDVGVGLLLGGGISYMSPLYGWSADRIAEMDVVLVNGELITVSATNEHAELFRALKGGANRFGIVTQFRIYAARTGTKEDKRWFGGTVTYPGSAACDVLKATAHYIRDVTDPKAAAAMAFNTIGTSASKAIVVYLFYMGESLPLNIFGEFLSIPHTSKSFSPRSYFDIALSESGAARGNGHQYGGASWLGDEETFLKGYNSFLDFTQASSHELAGAFIVVSPIPVSQWEASLSGPNAMGNPRVGYASISFTLAYAEGQTVLPKDVDERFRLMLSKTPSSPGLPLYINQCDASQDAFSTYGDLPALQKTYAKYDPTRFNIEHTDGPIGL